MKLKTLELYEDYIYGDILIWCGKNKIKPVEVASDITGNGFGREFIVVDNDIDNKIYSFVYSGYISSKGAVYKLIFKE